MQRRVYDEAISRKELDYHRRLPHPSNEGLAMTGGSVRNDGSCVTNHMNESTDFTINRIGRYNCYGLVEAVFYSLP